MSTGRNPVCVCVFLPVSFSENTVTRCNRVLGAVPSLLCKVLPLPVWLDHTGQHTAR